MPGEWYIETSEGEQGPLPLDELVERARVGLLTPTDRVRKGSQIWLRARNVTALAAVFQPPKDESAVAQPKAKEPAKGRGNNPAAGAHHQSALKTFLRGEVSRRVFGWFGGLAFILSVAAIAGWWSATDPTFPKPVSIPVDVQSPQRVAARANALLPPRPVVPSIPGLRKGVAHPIPGLEKLDTAYSPSLTADLCTIVFAAMGNPGTAYDLYLANRRTLGAAFGEPVLIKSCVSPDLEAYPSISSDGLELLFVRSDAQPIILFSRRESRDSEFAEPVEWEVAQQHAVEMRVDHPQFLDMSSVAFARLKQSIADREVLVASRPVDSMQFNEPQVILFEDRSCMYALASNQLRAYFASPEGISFVVRSSLSRTFVSPRPLITTDITGPVDGPVWVSPKEDLIVFCSPGVGQQPHSSRRLWMVQF